MKQLKNFLIKREQSQACLSFAKREKSRLLAKTLLTLVALLALTTGARADWTGGTYTATATENLGAITVNGDATLTINSDVTVTVTGGINVASGTLTVTGPGTLVVNGAKGNNGASGWEGSNGGNGGVAISGNIIVQGGATVTATGGNGGTGGSGAFEAGTGGNGGVAFAGTLTYKSGTVTANGGSAGSGGYIDDEERYASSGSAGKAFANDVDFTQTTGYSVTNGTSTIESVLNQTKVVISGGTEPSASSGPEVAWDKAEKTGTFTMPGGNVTLEPEYYPQAALTAAPTAINDVPATTDGAIVNAGTVANIGSTETAQGTVMYYVSPTALDDAALQALAADQWTADVPTAKSLAQGQAYVYYYVRGNDSDTDEENFSDGDINALTVTIAAVPTKVTMAVNDKTMGTAEVAGESKVEWTADTWKGWTADIKEYTVDDITMTSSQTARIREYISEDKYNNSLFFFVRKMYDDAVTFSTTGDPFSRIEFTMIGDYSQYNPDIIPNDNWTFEGKSAVWEGEATKSLTLQSCSTSVSKITFFKGAIPDGVTINGDGTFTVAKTATVTLKATPAEGYKFLYWEDDQTNTNPVRKVTIESGMADMTYKAVFAEILYNVTFAEGTDPNEWTATPNTDVKKGTAVTVTYTGTRKVMGVKAEKKGDAAGIVNPVVGQVIGSDGKNYDANATLPNGVEKVAMIAYVSGSNGLALALTDEDAMTWDNSAPSNKGKTAPELCSALNTSKPVTGGTWKLPSQDEWKQMFSANGGNEGSYTGLNTAIGNAGGTALLENEEYWSSSEVDEGYAWLVKLADGNASWYDEGKHYTRCVRACLAF